MKVHLLFGVCLVLIFACGKGYTDRENTLSQRAQNTYTEGQYAAAMHLFDSLIILGIEDGDWEMVDNAHLKFNVCAERIRNYDESPKVSAYIEQALIADPDVDSIHWYNWAKEKALYLAVTNEVEEAIRILKDIEPHIAQLDDKKYIGSFYDYLNMLYIQEEDYTQAILAGEKGIRYSMQSKEPEDTDIPWMYLNTAECYKLKGLINESTLYAHRGHSWLLRTGRNPQIIESFEPAFLMAQAENYLLSKQYHEANQIYRQVISTIGSSDNTMSTFFAYDGIITAMAAMGLEDSVIHYASEALKVLEQKDVDSIFRRKESNYLILELANAYRIQKKYPICDSLFILYTSGSDTSMASDQSLQYAAYSSLRKLSNNVSNRGALEILNAYDQVCEGSSTPFRYTQSILEKLWEIKNMEDDSSLIYLNFVDRCLNRASDSTYLYHYWLNRSSELHSYQNIPLQNNLTRPEYNRNSLHDENDIESYYWYVKYRTDLDEVERLNEYQIYFQELRDYITNRAVFGKNQQSIIRRQRKYLKEIAALSADMYLENQDEEYLELSLEILEFYKNLNFRLKLRSYILHRVAGYDTQLLDQEQALSSKIHFYADLIKYTVRDSFSAPFLDRYLDYYDSLSIAFDELKQKIAIEYPDYFKYKYALNQSFDAQTLMDSIPKNTIALDFIDFDDRCYTFVFSQDSKSLLKTHSTNRSIQEKAVNISDVWENVSPLIREHENILIAPDVMTAKISFDTMQFDGQSLIDQYNIYYAFSLSQNLIWSSSHTHDTQETRMTAIAPGFSDRLKKKIKRRNYQVSNTWYQLLQQPFTVKLLNDKLSKIHSKELIAGQATLTNLAKNNHGKILHIGTHSFTDESDAMQDKMALVPDQNHNEGYVSAAELYEQVINYDLAVLSSCESATGKESVENLRGLADAFYVSGCQNIIGTLWSVDEQSTCLLMKIFYTHLGDGLSTANALRQAKLDFKKKYSQFEDPFYWAGIVLVGNSQDLKIPSHNFFTWYFTLLSILIGFFIAFVVFLYHKKK